MKTLTIYFIIGVLIVNVISSCVKAESDDTSTYSHKDSKLFANIFLALEQEEYKTRAENETVISDLNIFVVNGDKIDKQYYIDRRHIEYKNHKVGYTLNLLKNVEYKIMVCANLGYSLPILKSLDEINDYRYYLAYSDEYRNGLPMSCVYQGKIENNDDEIDIELERLVSKISVRLDKSQLGKGIVVKVRGLAIRHCPKSVFPFKPSNARNERDVFNSGYYKINKAIDKLNIDEQNGISQSIDLYMLENRQGDLLPDITTEKQKILAETSPKYNVCSYIEMELEYYSDSYNTGAKEYLSYRCYLGDSPQNFDVDRNCHYQYILQPRGTGLEETSWRVIKTPIKNKISSEINIFPNSYIEGKVGDNIHVWGETTNPQADIDLDIEELEFDKNRGIYEYEIDGNNKGVQLHLKSKGTGIIYMTSGEYAAMAFIVVN